MTSNKSRRIGGGGGGRKEKRRRLKGFLLSLSEREAKIAGAQFQYSRPSSLPFLSADGVISAFFASSNISLLQFMRHFPPPIPSRARGGKTVIPYRHLLRLLPSLLPSFPISCLLPSQFSAGTVVSKGRGIGNAVLCGLRLVAACSKATVASFFFIPWHVHVCPSVGHLFRGRTSPVSLQQRPDFLHFPPVCHA